MRSMKRLALLVVVGLFHTVSVPSLLLDGIQLVQHAPAPSRPLGEVVVPILTVRILCAL